MQYLTAGIDPTTLPCISKADILQLITAAVPRLANKIGFVIFAESAPDVITNPEQASFIWGDTTAGVPNGDFYYYNGTSWTLIFVINGAALINQSVTLNKISFAGANPYDIIQLNAAGTALVYLSIAAAVQNNTIAIAKLINPGAGNLVFVSMASTNQFITFTALANALPAVSIYPASLIAPLSGTAMLVSIGGTASFVVDTAFGALIPPNSVNIDVLKALITTGTPLTAGQSIRRNAGNTAWEAYTPSTVTGYTGYAAILRHVVASGTNGGAMPTASWHYRLLNDLYDPHNIITMQNVPPLSSIYFTLQPGTYRVSAQAAANQVNYHQLRLLNYTDLTTIASGLNAFSIANTSIATLATGFTLAAAKQISLQHRNFTIRAADDAMGQACSFGDEVYVNMTITKEI